MKGNNELKGLSDYLKEEYEEQITQIQRDTNKANADLLTQATTRGEKEAQRITQEAQQRAQQSSKTAIAAAHTQARQLTQAVQAKNAQKVYDALFDSLMSEPTKELQKVVEQMSTDIQQIEPEAEIHVWKNAKIKGTTADLDYVGVKAETTNKVVEDSLATRIEPLKERAMKLVEEHKKK